MTEESRPSGDAGGRRACQGRADMPLTSTQLAEK